MSEPSFRINIRQQGKGYKSIKSVVWSDVPNFAIVTGRNGSGKTQLLEILSYYFTGTLPNEGSLGVHVTVDGAIIEADEVGFVPSAGRFSGGEEAHLSLKCKTYDKTSMPNIKIFMPIGTIPFK